MPRPQLIQRRLAIEKGLQLQSHFGGSGFSQIQIVGFEIKFCLGRPLSPALGLTLVRCSRRPLASVSRGMLFLAHREQALKGDGDAAGSAEPLVHRNVDDGSKRVVGYLPDVLACNARSNMLGLSN